MKKIILSQFALLFLFVSALAEDFKSPEEAVKKLAAYTVADIEGDQLRLKEHKDLKIDDMFNDLESAAKYLEKNPLTEDLAYQMGRVTVITFINDPSAFAVDLILPTYQKNKKLFEKAAKRLHSYDRTLLLETLKSHDQALTEGNG